MGKTNSGNSTEPHLHFQIMDRPSTLAANGLPYAFDHCEVYPSKTTKKNEHFSIKLLPQKNKKIINQLILENGVIKLEG